jgi:hypothetical protein
LKNLQQYAHQLSIMCETPWEHWLLWPILFHRHKSLPPEERKPQYAGHY